MDRSDRYRHFAKECLDLARTALSEQSRATFLLMAQVWNRLADEHEREAKVIKRISAR
jgi:phytoene/squalene synthetase